MNKNQTFKDLIRQPNFVKLWMSQLLSQITINMMNFLIITRVYQVTKSNIAVSLVWIASSLPALIFGPFSGVIVDTVSRKRILIITNIVQGVSILLALLVPVRKIFPLYLITFLYWLFDQLYFPAQQASVPSLVNKKFLDAANGIFLLTQQATVLLGIGLGGVFLGLLGAKLTILICGICLFIAAISVSMLPDDKPVHKISEQSFLQYWKDFLKGYRFIKTHHLVFIPMILVVISQIYNAIIATSIPSFAHEILNLNLNNAGIALIVPGGIGAITFTFLSDKIFTGKRKKKMIETGFLFGGISLVVMSLVSNLYFDLRLFISVVSCFFLGAAVGMIVVPAQSLIQRNTPVWFRGRVYAQMGFLLIIATTIPLFASATLADSLGVSAILFVMGILLLGGYYLSHKKGDYVLANGFRI